MTKAIRVSIYIVVWVVAIALLLYLGTTARERRAQLRLSGVEIVILDQRGDDGFVSAEMVEQMLSESKILIVDEPVKSLSLSLIERVIESNGFIERASAHIDYQGVLHIEVKPRTALARLMLNGYNSYITREGVLFSSPIVTSIDLPIITGNYKPLFEPHFTGSIRERKRELCEELQMQIERIEREKYPIYLRNEENNDERRSLRRRYINRSIMELEEEFSQRVVALRQENQKVREMIAYKQRLIDSDLKRLEQRQEAYAEEQKKVTQRCEDIENLIIFVETIERDPFWRAEVLQIELTGGEYGEQMRVSLVVRSGRFFISLGSISGERGSEESIKSRLAMVERLYDDILPRVGWDRYREISVEFKDQIVCRR